MDVIIQIIPGYAFGTTVFSMNSLENFHKRFQFISENGPFNMLPSGHIVIGLHQWYAGISFASSTRFT